VMAGITEVARRHGDVPVWLAGYSFGALVAAAVNHPCVAGWLLVAPPLGLPSGAPEPACARDPRPKVLVVAQHDELCPPACVDQHAASWVNTQQVVLPSATHALLAQRTTLAQIAVDVMLANSAGPTPQHPPR
jgi:alpha/beta superfamily hydrolase